jgi:proline iminopeptidase
MNLLIENKATKLFVNHYQNPGKETVILLHGGPGVPDGLGAIADCLNKDFNVILFHQRGTLHSPCLDRNYSIESYISDIDCIAAYFNLGKFHLFGHSWGGLYAQIYASKRAENLLSVFLCSPAPGTGRHWRQAMFEIAAFNKSRCTFSEWVQMGINSSLGFFGSDKAYQKLFTQMALNFNRGFTVSKLIPFEIRAVKSGPIIPTTIAILSYPLLNPMPHTAFKITVVYGDGDIIEASKKYVKERYPQANFFILPHSGHLPWLHNEKVFFERLKEHFKIA